MTRKYLIAGLLACLTASLPCNTMANEADPAVQANARRMQLVIQVSDNDAAKWNLALNNARNIQSELGRANADIEIIVYGPGIAMLKMDSPVAVRVAEAGASGVKMVACQNTMATQKLSRDDMLPDIAYAKAGVLELAQRQRQGWAYIRP